MATTAPAAALGWGGRSTGGLGGGAHAAACTSFRGRKSASTCAAPASATVQRGARAPCCRRNGRAVQPCIWQPPRPKIAAAFHRAARHVQRAHCARLLARGNKTPDARSEAAAHCGNPGTGVPRARSSPRVTAALLVRRRQAHRGSGAPLLFATTGRVPREQFRAHQWRRKQRTEWTSADGKARMENCRAFCFH